MTDAETAALKTLVEHGWTTQWVQTHSSQRDRTPILISPQSTNSFPQNTSSVCIDGTWVTFDDIRALLHPTTPSSDV